MSWDIFGYIGTILVLYSFTIESIKKLRLVNGIGSIFWIAYGIGIVAWPTIIVNSCVLLIHTYWFIKHKNEWIKKDTKLDPDFMYKWIREKSGK